MPTVKNEPGTKSIVPISNINGYIRVPGRERAALSKALQEWDGVTAKQVETRDPGFKETRPEYRILFAPYRGYPETMIRVSEQIYEVALYTLATRRFTAWMRANGKG